MEIALLILRLIFGLIIAAHGAQKLFGWFGGPGMSGTSGMMQSLGLKPAFAWAFAAGATEFGGGLLMAMGFLNPLGAIAVISAMVMAIVLVHSGKGLWASNGGSELPLANITVALALLLAGPGSYSLDAALGVSLPGAVTLIVAALAVVAIALAMASSAKQSASSGTADA